MRGVSSSEADPQKTTRLQLGRPVGCNYGPAGTLSDVVIDPGVGAQLTHVVLQRSRPSDAGPAVFPIDSVSAIETDRITVTPPVDPA